MRLSDIDLRLLRVFKAVAEAGGIVKAQDDLGISQPTISSHIANLENRLNVRLCTRGAAGFALTNAGREILDETEKLLVYMDHYSQRLADIGQTQKEVLRIGAIDGLVTDPACPIRRALHKIHRDYPGARVSLGIFDYLDCLSELRAGRLDVAILGLEGSAPDDLEADHLYDETSGLFCSTEHPCAQLKNPQDIEEELKKSLVSANAFVLDPLEGALDLALMDRDSGVSQSHIESIAHLVLAGSHVGLLPHHFAAHWMERGEMVCIAQKDYSVISEIHAVRRKGQSLNAVAVAFCDALVETT